MENRRADILLALLFLSDTQLHKINFGLRKTTPMPEPRIQTHDQSSGIRVVKSTVDVRHSA